MRRMRSPSCTKAFCGRSVEATGCLATCNPAENGADRHAKPGEIALAENVAGHDLTGGENIRRSPAIAHLDRSVLVHFHAQIGECDAWTQRICEERRRIEFPCPIRLIRIQSPRAAA